MVPQSKRMRALVLRLIVGLALLGGARVGSAQGTWSVISLPWQPSEIVRPGPLAVDTAGNLYAAAYHLNRPGEIQKRDTQGNWSVIDAAHCEALAADAAGSLYVADGGGIRKRDAQGNWSVIATVGTGPGQVHAVLGVAVDSVGNLYTAELGPGDRSGGGGESGPNHRIQKRDAQGNWSRLAAGGIALGQIRYPVAVAADPVGNLYVAELLALGRIQQRHTQGNWSAIATGGSNVGQVDFWLFNGFSPALAVDSVGNLYVADGYLDEARS